MSFNELQLDQSILKAIAEAGYTKPTPIQAQAIPTILSGQDLMASAQTGTGKTAAFILPALHKLSKPSSKPGRGPRLLVLTPTRELATQIAQAASLYSKYSTRIKTVCILGGMPYMAQVRHLSQPFEILVATPGRLIDYLERGRIDFSRIEMLVLDEADRMLDMGFINDVEHIVRATPENRQTLLFSATLKGSVASLAKNMLKNPLQIHVAATKANHDNIEQRLYHVDDIHHKTRLLLHLLNDSTINQAIIFTATKRHVDQLVDTVREQGHTAAGLHGDMGQRERNRTLANLRQGAIRMLVATDVAARGIDVPGITHVINFDLPQSSEDYVHRIGRTGRAGATGIALSFASGKDTLILERIERYMGKAITPHTVSGLEPRFKPAFRNDKNSFRRPTRPQRRMDAYDPRNRRPGRYVASYSPEARD